MSNNINNTNPESLYYYKTDEEIKKINESIPAFGNIDSLVKQIKKTIDDKSKHCNTKSFTKR